MSTQTTNDKDAGLAMILIVLIIAIAKQDLSFLLPITLLLVLAMTVPIVFRPFSIVWFKLSTTLGHYSSIAVLTLLFIMIVVPISYLRRISGADTLQLKHWKSNKDSAFSKKEHKYKPIDMDKPF